MARVAVLVDDLERGDLPAVSAATGRPCIHPVGLVLRPGSHFWTVFAPRVHAVVPMEAERVRRVRIMIRGSWFLLALALAGLVASATGGGAVALWVGIVAAVLYVAVVVLGTRWSIGARVGAEGSIVLTRVAPGFVRAVDEQYGRVSR